MSPQTKKEEKWEKRTQKIEKLLKELIAQQLIFKKSNQELQASSHPSYVVAYEISKRGKPFFEGKFVKDCMLKVAKIVWPHKQRTFQNVSLSRMVITCRVEEIGSDIKDQLNSGIQKYLSVSLALDEFKDIGSTAQLLIFMREVTEDFQISEELFAVVSLSAAVRWLNKGATLMWFFLLRNKIAEFMKKSKGAWTEMLSMDMWFCLFYVI